MTTPSIVRAIIRGSMLTPAANRFGAQSTENLPQYALRVDDKGDIYAEGLDELLYGRLSNVL